MVVVLLVVGTVLSMGGYWLLSGTSRLLVLFAGAVTFLGGVALALRLR